MSRHEKSVFHVTCDFRRFRTTPEGGSETAVELTVREIEDTKSLLKHDEFTNLCDALKLSAKGLADPGNGSWTICVLEELKEKAKDIKKGRLKWVLRTAMPLKIDFRVYVDEDEIKREKAEFQPVIEFSVADLGDVRLARLNKKLNEQEQWHRNANCLEIVHISEWCVRRRPGY